MFTKNEFTCVARVLSFSSRLYTIPFSFRGGKLLEKVPPHKKYLRALRLELFALEIFVIILTLPTTVATGATLSIVGHGFYILTRAATIIIESNLLFYNHELQELLNQTVSIDADFRARYLEGKEIEKTSGEIFFFFVIFMGYAVLALFHMCGLFLIFADLPFTVFPGSEALRGNVWIFLLVATLRIGIYFEETGPMLISIIGFFCINSTFFWLQKACIAWPMDATVPVDQCQKVYKSAFLLNRLNDAGLGRLFIPAGKAMILLVYINVPIVALFFYWNQLDIITIFTFLSVLAVTVPILVTRSTIMSAIYDISSKFQRNMHQKIQGCGNKAMRKAWSKDLRSYQIVRCRIGNFYYMEGKTKLVLVNTILNVFVFMVVQRKPN